MKRTIVTVIAVAASAAFATSALAQGRHDDKPHGFDAKVAAEQAAGTPSASGFVTLPTGPRAHDNPLRGKKLALAQPEDRQVPVTASASKK